jgi:AcrR family transcriptional regulator
LPEETRDRILAAARECFTRFGLKKTSVEEIAEAAGVGKGTVYLHFKDKNDLFLAVIGERMRALDEATLAGLEAEPDALRRLSRMLRNVMRFLDGEPLLSGLMSSSPELAAGRLRPFVARCHDDAITMLEGVLRQGVEAGQIIPHNTRLMASVMFGTYQSFYFGGGKALATPDEFVTLMEQLVERGIGGPARKEVGSK